MRIIHLLVAFILVIGVFVSARAQLCGAYEVKLVIHDEDLNQVKDRSIDIVPLVKDELKGKTFTPEPGGMSLNLQEGHVIREKYKVIIGAPGFDDTERIVQFPHCKRISYDILMVKRGAKRTRVSGQLENENGSPLGGGRIIFLRADKVERSTETDFDGNYETKLEPGEYSIEVNLTDHEPFRLDRFIVPADGEAQLDVLLQTLKVASPIPWFLLKGAVFDENKALVPGTRLTAIDQTGRKFVTETGNEGKFQCKLPTGKYRLLFERDGFRPTRIMNFDQVETGEKTINVKLEVGRCNDCNWADHVFGERWDDFTTVQGTVYDVKGYGLPKATVRFYTDSGQESYAETNSRGFYEIRLPVDTEDVYKIKAEKGGYQPYWIERYRLPVMEKGKITLDLVLETVVCDDCN